MVLKNCTIIKMTNINILTKVFYIAKIKAKKTLFNFDQIITKVQ